MSCALIGTGCRFHVVLFPQSGMPGVLKQAVKQLTPQQTAHYSFCAHKCIILSHVFLCTNMQQGTNCPQKISDVLSGELGDTVVKTGLRKNAETYLW